MIDRRPLLLVLLAGGLLLSVAAPTAVGGGGTAAHGPASGWEQPDVRGDQPARGKPGPWSEDPGRDRPGNEEPGPGRPGDGGPGASPAPGTAISVYPGLGGRDRAGKVARGHVVVQFAPSMPGWQRQQIALAAGGAAYQPSRGGRFARVRVHPGQSPRQLARRLAAQAGVLTAELDPLCQGQALSVLPAAPGLVSSLTGLTFTDPLAELQWTFSRVRLGEGLDLSPRLGEGVIVAVIDSGVAFGSGESYPGRRGVDLEGTRFAPGLDLVNGGAAFDEGVSVGGSSSLFGHGTFAAAQIAATINNGIAGGSVAPRATILPIRVLGLDNRGSFSAVAEAIDFAVARGARVINMSLGGPEGSTVLHDAIRRARAAGAVLVASAGNSAEEPDFGGDALFPARYPEVIAVGATAFSDARARYSNFGPGLDLVAPAGESAVSEVAPGVRDAALAPSFLHFSDSGTTLYGSFWATGTSFAAPQVAGAAALLVSLGIDDPEAVRLLLLERTRDLAAPGRDDATGRGLLDILSAHRGLGFAF